MITNNKNEKNHENNTVIAMLVYNYSEEEIALFKQIVQNSADLFYKYAKEGECKK